MNFADAVDEFRLFAHQTFAHGYYQGHFAALHHASGVLLENFVYYRSTGAFTESATHYFLMTTELAALHAFGAVLDAALTDADGAPLDPCRTTNLHLARLESYAREAVRRRSPIGVFWLLGCRRREVGGAQQRDRQRVGRRRKRRLCDFAHPPAAEIT